MCNFKKERGFLKQEINCFHLVPVLVIFMGLIQCPWKPMEILPVTSMNAGPGPKWMCNSAEAKKVKQKNGCGRETVSSYEGFWLQVKLSRGLRHLNTFESLSLSVYRNLNSTKLNFGPDSPCTYTDINEESLHRSPWNYTGVKSGDWSSLCLPVGLE